MSETLSVEAYKEDTDDVRATIIGLTLFVKVKVCKSHDFYLTMNSLNKGSFHPVLALIHMMIVPPA
jgi:hypothetical protein